MKIPISYNIRNLIARRTTTIMTALGIALTVAVLLSIFALVEGLRSSLVSTGDPLNLLVTRKGSTAELNSSMTQEQFQVIKVKPGIAKLPNGEPMASLELVTVIVLESPDNPAGINISMRGLTATGVGMRENVKITEGRIFQSGKREIVVGKGVAKRYPTARLGSKIDLGRGQWEVVGVMDGGRSAANSEIFCDLAQLAADQNREAGLSSVLLRATDEVAMQALTNDLTGDQRLNVDAVSERAYYEAQTSAAAPIQFLGIFVAIIMSIGSSFAAMNTMYAAVARRAPEIGTLRVLGFSKPGILISFMLESLLLSLLGGVMGCLLVLPLNNFTTGIGSFTTFSEITFDFRITPGIMLSGIIFALVMGVIGGLFPAFSAARKQILTALKQN
ncbi:MAG: ABC transporter permease [Acidobacteria bacterium]|nr:ABC transporter permease [Acidobacteriota bacterium]